MKHFILLLLFIASIFIPNDALMANDALGPEDSPVQSECRAQVTVTQTNAQPQPAYNATLFNYRADVTTDIKECAVVGFRVYTHTPRLDRSDGSMFIEGGDPHTVGVRRGTESIEGSLQVHTLRSRVFWVTDYVSCMRCETAAKRNFPKEQTTDGTTNPGGQRDSSTSPSTVTGNSGGSQQDTGSPAKDRNNPYTREINRYSDSISPSVKSESIKNVDDSTNGTSWLGIFGAIVQGLAEGFADVANQNAYRQTLQNEIKRQKSQSTNYQTIPSFSSYPSSSPPATAQPPLNQHGNSDCPPPSTSCY